MSRQPLHGPYDDFQGFIDETLAKHDPSASIPWPDLPVPAWALDRRPAEIMDVGAATGRFTTAVLQKLGAWDCLSRLRRLHLVEEEPSFAGPGGEAVEREVRTRSQSALGRSTSARVEVRLSNVSAAPSGQGRSPLMVGGVVSGQVDLIIASHVTYYFPDGGRALLRAVGSTLRPRGGFGWIVVRRRDCPLYRARQHALAIQSGPQGDPETFAEDLEEWLASDGSGLELIDVRDQSFLAGLARSRTLLDAASLLMWRRPYAALAASEEAALEHALDTDEPLFTETHFIVGPRVGSS